MVQVNVHGGRVVLCDPAALNGGLAVLPTALFAVGRLVVVESGGQADLRWSYGEGADVPLLSYGDNESAAAGAAGFGPHIAGLAGVQGLCGHRKRAACHPAWRVAAVLAMATLLGTGAFAGGVVWNSGVPVGRGVQVAGGGVAVGETTMASASPVQRGIAQKGGVGAGVGPGDIAEQTRQAEQRIQQELAKLVEKQRAEGAGAAAEPVGNPTGVFVPLE